MSRRAKRPVEFSNPLYNAPGYEKPARTDNDCFRWALMHSGALADCGTRPSRGVEASGFTHCQLTNTTQHREMRVFLDLPPLLMRRSSAPGILQQKAISRDASESVVVNGTSMPEAEC